MPHTIPQPPSFELLVTAVAFVIILVGVLIAIWQTVQSRQTSYWRQIALVWLVPVVIGILQWLTTSPNGTLRWPYSGIALLVLGGWALAISVMKFGTLTKWQSAAALGLSGSAASFVVICLLSPALYQARNAAWRTSHNCSLKIVGLAIHNFQDVYQSLPSPADGDPPFSWRVAVLPYVDEAALHERYRFDAAWDSEENMPIARTAQRTCHRRSDDNWRDALGRYYCYFAMITGPGTIWESGRRMATKDITDGTSNTILVGEAAGWKLVWTEPRDVDVRQATWDINRPGPTPDVSQSLLSSPQQGGAYVMLADGAVRFLSQKIDPQVLKALVSPQGREKVGEF